LRRVHSRQLKVSEKEFVAYHFGPGKLGRSSAASVRGLAEAGRGWRDGQVGLRWTASGDLAEL